MARPFDRHAMVSQFIIDRFNIYDEKRHRNRHASTCHRLRSARFSLDRPTHCLLMWIESPAWLFARNKTDVPRYLNCPTEFKNSFSDNWLSACKKKVLKRIRDEGWIDSFRIKTHLKTASVSLYDKLSRLDLPDFNVNTSMCKSLRREEHRVIWDIWSVLIRPRLIESTREGYSSIIKCFFLISWYLTPMMIWSPGNLVAQHWFQWRKKTERSISFEKHTCQYWLSLRHVFLCICQCHRRWTYRNSSKFR